MSQPTAIAPEWIVSRAFDLTLFFGGAALSLLFLILYVALGAPVVTLWWIWLLAFDGPHVGAAFTRTYLDRLEWARRPGVLVASLLTFAVGPACLLIGVLTRSDAPFLLFLGFATLYGYYHVVRQHYGFVALYNAANRDFDARTVSLDRWTLYLGLWLPYVYFVFSHPRARALLRLPAVSGLAGIENVVLSACAAVWVVALLWFVAAYARRRSLHNPKVAYVLVTVILYGVIYFAVSRLEPTYLASTGPDQDFLLLSILVVVFHNVQYLGLVWFHNRNRYGNATGHGPADLINRSAPVFLGACALFSVVIYLTFACSTGVFPYCAPFADRRLGPISWNQAGLCLWWGLAMNHYFLDQKIWRIRGDSELKRNLGLA